MTVNLRTVKKDLAAAYPDVEFTYGTAGRGRQKGHAISWKGGPDQTSVRLASHVGAANWRQVWHFHRIMSDVEQMAYEAKQNADPNSWGSDAWVADTDAREARQLATRTANRKAGAAQAAETRAHRKPLLAKLAAAFPGVDFTLTKYGPSWTDGPTCDAVIAAIPDEGWTARSCTKYESPAIYQARLARLKVEEAAWLAGAPEREAEQERQDMLEEARYEAENEDYERTEAAEQAEADRLEALEAWGFETVPDVRQILMFA